MDLEVLTFSQNQYFYLSFQTFKGTLKMLQITFCPQIQQKISLKWPWSLKHLGYAAEIFWISCSQWDYQMVNISRILKFLTWHGFDEFGWNDPILSMVNYSQLMISFKKLLIKRRYLPWIFFQIIISVLFLAMLQQNSSSKQILQLFPQLFVFFFVDFSISRTIPYWVIFAKM